MILYFTSTNNCKYIAERLGDSLNDHIASIFDTKDIRLKKGEKLGFVFPTYFWRLPSVVDEYMKNISITSEDANPYIYFIATYGTTCGQTGTFMKRHLKAIGHKLSAAYSIKMVDDWTVLFDTNNKDMVKSVLKEEKPLIEQTIASIKACETGDRMKGKLPMIAVCGSKFFYDKARRTIHLHVEDSCVGCGLCERECPMGAIKIKNDKPVWIKERCTMCLHCLHSCPKFAIQYDDKTQEHGQYKHP